jgi:hypothetical protein
LKVIKAIIIIIAVTHHKINLLKFPLRSSSFERTDVAFVLLICFCVFDL